jgi:hypothetical protein
MRWPRRGSKKAETVKTGGEKPVLMDVWPSLGSDKCDRCPSYAKVRILVPHSGLVIDLCAHHFRRNRAHFDEKGYIWIDGRSEKEKFTQTHLDISGSL